MEITSRDIIRRDETMLFNWLIDDLQDLVLAAAAQLSLVCQAVQTGELIGQEAQSVQTTDAT